MKKKLKFAAYQYGKVYKDSDADKCVYIEIHARSLSLRKTTEVQAAFPPNAFPVENIAQNPGQKKDKSAPSRGGCAGELLYSLFRREKAECLRSSLAGYPSRRGNRMFKVLE